MNLGGEHAAPAATTLERSVKKYLPHTYRASFNFVGPRTPNAVTDDTYHCAVRAAERNPAFKQSPEAISWGKVFASAMRQPQLATALGMIYTTEITVNAAHFPKGGWLYVDLDDDSDYKAQQTADPTFVKRYAARIPVLEIGKQRSVFGAIQFPVSPIAPPGNYDELFIEAAEFDDGFAKVVHAFQPASQNLLEEKSDGFHPTGDAGIRLGWDDEQILIWYIRQLAEDASVGAGKRIDAPIGMFGYRIDVREDKPVLGVDLAEPGEEQGGAKGREPGHEPDGDDRPLYEQGAALSGLPRAARRRSEQDVLAPHVLCRVDRQVDGAAG